MEVAVSDLRAHLVEWLSRAKAGEEIVITQRGSPVARLLGVEQSPVIERLEHDGIIARPTGLRRPASRSTSRVRATPGHPVSDYISDHRR